MYETKTLEQLFLAYQHENGRAVKKEADETKRLIVREILQRITKSAAALERAESESDARQVYKQFIER